jgi:hypothetical protein
VSKKLGGIKTVAGFSFIGFCAVSILADRVKLDPGASQLAGFVGAFLGACVAKRRPARKEESAAELKSSGESE